MREKTNLKSKKLKLGLQFFAEEGTDMQDQVEAMTDVPESDDNSKVQEEKASSDKYAVKYNGKEYFLGIDELITNAQKGMNYDHVLRERDEARAKVQKDEQLNEFVELVNAYPELRKLPDEVASDIADGKKPIDAYRDYEIKVLREQVAAKEQAEKNKNAPKSAKGVPDGNDGDSFLRGFMS